MPCKACAAVRQYVLNWLVLDDLALNTALGGRTTETVSHRLAREREAGSTFARIACAVLTWIGKRFFGATEDHCTWSLEGAKATSAEGGLSHEVWHWSPPDE